MRKSIFTIGHSNHTVEHFAALLAAHGVTALCDVRSKPYSQRNPQFNRQPIRRSLRQYGIAYVFLGLELGARSQDRSCYDNGKVQYERLAQTDLFRAGLARIQKGVEKYRIALMCAEKEPLECHRSILIARNLETLGFDVQHIHADGKAESHPQALMRLIRLLKLSPDDLFRTRELTFADAYRIQADRIAYQNDTPGSREVAG